MAISDGNESEEGTGEHHPQGSFLHELSKLSYKDLLLAIAKMNAGQKQILALKGSPSVRKVLLRDPNLEVQLAIVNSPKASEAEIEQVAGHASTAEVVLKAIASDGRWTKSYRVRLALAKNPKTPAGMATKCLMGLTAHDLKKLAIDPGVKKVIAQAAQRMVKTQK